MKYFLYSIRDKYRGFMQPAMDMDDNAAKREFAIAINNSPQGMGYAPRDFDFYKIAMFNSESGKVNPIDPPEFICNGQEVFNEKSES